MVIVVIMVIMDNTGKNGDNSQQSWIIFTTRIIINHYHYNLPLLLVPYDGSIIKTYGQWLITTTVLLVIRIVEQKHEQTPLLTRANITYLITITMVAIAL